MLPTVFHGHGERKGNSLSNIEDVRMMTVAAIDRQLVNASQIANEDNRLLVRLKAIDVLVKLLERKSRIIGIDQQATKVELKQEVAVRIYEGLEETTDETPAIDVTPERKLIDESIQKVTANWAVLAPFRNWAGQ